ncbi:MAG: hypothetical protein AVDCRST_MAG64-4354, partial [uncultured Phycisphaerae bacterium]
PVPAGGHEPPGRVQRRGAGQRVLRGQQGGGRGVLLRVPPGVRDRLRRPPAVGRVRVRHAAPDLRQADGRGRGRRPADPVRQRPGVPPGLHARRGRGPTDGEGGRRAGRAGAGPVVLRGHRPAAADGGGGGRRRPPAGPVGRHHDRARAERDGPAGDPVSWRAERGQRPGAARVRAAVRQAGGRDRGLPGDLPALPRGAV